MTIQRDLIYSIKEASEILNIHPRKLNRIAVKHDITKTDNRYLFEGSFLIDYFNLTDVKESQKVSKDVKTLEGRIKQLEAELESKESKDHQQLDLQLEALQIENESLKEELRKYDINDNERIEIFTNDEYNMLEKRLQEWYSLQKDIQHQEQLFNVEKKSLTEILEHYKNQFEYQKQQSNKILEMHQKLIDTVQKQSAISLQRNIIEASEKEVIKKDTWTTKD